MSADRFSKLTRRGFLQHSSAAAMVGLFGRTFDRFPIPVREAGGHVADPTTVQMLAHQAIDAARSAGADYADVRLTRTLAGPVNSGILDHEAYVDKEGLGVGVRVLVNGYWGFAASPYWEPDEVVRLARNAVAQAKVTAATETRPAELGTYPAVTGSWTMPVRQDPFRIPLAERFELQDTISSLGNQYLPARSILGGRTSALFGISYWRQERALATTDGTYVTQMVYGTEGSFRVAVGGPQGNVAAAYASGLASAGRGWEVIAEAQLFDQIPTLLAKAEADALLPWKPVEVGRYDVVCDAATMAGLVEATFGRATELDRALGYEANASGTSYLGPNPLAYLGTSVASPLVNVTANRSLVGGLATVKWDDEGIAPLDVPLVTHGTLADYQTTREQAEWLAPWYQHQGRAVRSHGCASAEDALSISMQMTPNLDLLPSASATTLAELISGTEKGIAICGGVTETDFQSIDGTVSVPGEDPPSDYFYEIQHGKVVAKLSGAGMLFRSTELWKNITALGGAASILPVGTGYSKGQPSQHTRHTVRAVPAAIKNMALFDMRRKA